MFLKNFETVVGDDIDFFHQSPDPDIESKCESSPDTDPSVFLKRYLKKMRDLGEVSSLCFYMSKPDQHFTPWVPRLTL